MIDLHRINQFENLLKRLSAALAIFGGVGLLAVVFVTCLSILLKLLRSFADTLLGTEFMASTLPFIGPILGEEEIVSYGVGFAIFAALPWTMINRAHLRVELFKTNYSIRINLFLNFLGDLTLATIAYLILTRQWFAIFKRTRSDSSGFFESLFSGEFEAAFDLIKTSQSSQILNIPLWPTYIVAEILMLLFLFVACFCVLNSFRELLRYKPHER